MFDISKKSLSEEEKKGHKVKCELSGNRAFLTTGVKDLPYQHHGEPKEARNCYDDFSVETDAKF